MYIVIYRPHGALKIETMHYGPFLDYVEAEEFMTELPAVGAMPAKFLEDERGCKYIQPLTPPKV